MAKPSMRSFFRKEMPQQDDLVERAKEIYCPLGAKWREQHKMFNMPQGGRVRFRPLESIQDAVKYQGQSITDAAVVEAGNYPMPAPIDRLNGVLRSAKGVPTQLILTGNPGGLWTRMDQGSVHRSCTLRLASLRTPPRRMAWSIGMSSSPRSCKTTSFCMRKMTRGQEWIGCTWSGPQQLVRAWLEGDWSAIEGAFFP